MESGLGAPGGSGFAGVDPCRRRGSASLSQTDGYHRSGRPVFSVMEFPDSWRQKIILYAYFEAPESGFRAVSADSSAATAGPP